MARTAAARPRLTRLREDLARGQAPLAAGQPRVDRAAGIIFGVKVVGAASPNANGQAGAAKGTVYTEAALREALPLYEGAAVNVNHPRRHGPREDRAAGDRLGKLVGARMVGGELYADLHLLKSHPMAERLMEAAERMPDAFALSHHAYGRGPVVRGTYRIEEIARVDSVDVVADGGTNKGLFEGRQVKQTLAEFLESAPAGKFWRLRRLVEEYGGAGEMEAVDEGDAEPDELDHLYNAFRALKEKDPEKANKILAMLKADKPEDLEESDEEPVNKETAAAGKGKAEEEKKAMEESRRRVTRLARGFLQLRESEKPVATLVDALVKLPDEESRLALLESWPRGAQAPARGAPRSAAPYTPGATLRESAPARDAAELAAALLR